jgi:hypothetical protein
VGVLGYGAFEGGAALLPMTVAIMVLMVVVAPKAISRFGPKAPIVAGMLLLAAGMAGLSLVRSDGMSLAFIPSLGTAIQSAKPEEGGLASGIVNTAYQVGSALGLAAMTAVAGSQGADRMGNPEALTDGYSAAFLGAAGVALAGALLAADAAPARGRLACARGDAGGRGRVIDPEEAAG